MEQRQIVVGGRTAVMAYAVLAPLLVGAVLALWRDRIPHPTVVLVLVVVIVGAAATGIRWAGWGASIMSALTFDWFHTVPRGTFAIDKGEDLQVAVLLLVVGVAVTELALWGQRWQSAAAESAARLAGLVTTANSVADDRGSDVIAREIEEQLVALLDLDRATWVPDTPPADATVLRRDGVMVREGVEQTRSGDNFPAETAVALPVQGATQVLGRFDLVASTHLSRPSEASLRVAFLLADQLAAACSRQGPPRKEPEQGPDRV